MQTQPKLDGHICKRVVLEPDIQKRFKFKVKPEHRCAAIYKEPLETVFIGFVQWSNYYNEWYLTIDGISYTKLEHAYDIEGLFSF